MTLSTAASPNKFTPAPLITDHFFLWDGQNEIATLDVSNNLLQLRILGQGLGNEIGAAIAVELRTNAASAFNIYVPIHDHRGNVALLLNQGSGTVAEFYRYDAFGNGQIFDSGGTPIPASAIGNPWRFSSKRFDPETGLTYFGARYYDPTIGRFITTDPSGFLDGPNKYIYVRNNPLTRVDPDGRLAAGTARGALNFLSDEIRGLSDFFRNGLLSHPAFPLLNAAQPFLDPLFDAELDLLDRIAQNLSQGITSGLGADPDSVFFSRGEQAGIAGSFLGSLFLGGGSGAAAKGSVKAQSFFRRVLDLLRRNVDETPKGSGIFGPRTLGAAEGWVML